MTNKIQHFPSRLWRLLFLALPLAACTSEVTDEDLPAGASPIAFRTAEVTKAVVDDNNPMTEFSVWGWYGETSKTQVFNAQKVEYIGNAWTYSPYQYWRSGETYRFYALYPTKETLAGDGCKASYSETGALSITEFDATKGHDLMTAQSDVMYGDNPAQVAFTFNHLLSRVKVLVTRSSQWGADGSLQVTASFYGMASKGNFENGTWTNLEREEEASTAFQTTNLQLTQDEPQKSLFTTTEIPDGSIMFIPQDITEEVKLEISYTADGQPAITPDPIIIYNHTGKWESATSYLYEITINPDGIIFDNLQADEWGETSYEGSIPIK